MTNGMVHPEVSPASIIVSATSKLIFNTRIYTKYRMLVRIHCGIKYYLRKIVHHCIDSLKRLFQLRVARIKDTN